MAQNQGQKLSISSAPEAPPGNSTCSLARDLHGDSM